MFCVSCFFLFSFSRLFPLPDAFPGVSLTNARFSDRIRSVKRKIVSGTVLPLDLAVVRGNIPTFVSGQREQVTERINLFNYTNFLSPALVG